MRLVLLLLLLSSISYAQIDTLNRDQPLNQSIIEDFIQETGGEGEFDFNTIFEQLEEYAEDPIDLNLVTDEQLKELGILNDIQIVDFLNYRIMAGELISTYELQSIPSFDLNTIRNILPYVTVRGNVNDYQLPITQMLYEGNNELYLRWERVLEEQRGFTPRVLP